MNRFVWEGWGVFTSTWNCNLLNLSWALSIFYFYISLMSTSVYSGQNIIHKMCSLLSIVSNVVFIIIYHCIICFVIIVQSNCIVLLIELWCLHTTKIALYSDFFVCWISSVWVQSVCRAYKLFDSHRYTPYYALWHCDLSPKINELNKF